MTRLLVALLAVELLLPASTARSAQGAIDPADIGVAIRADEPFGVPGKPATYTVVVRNNGPDAAPPVLLTLTTDAADLTDAVPTQGTCDLTVSVPQCNLGGVAAGATATIDVTVTPVDHNRASFLTAEVSSDIEDPFSGTIATRHLSRTQLTVDLTVSKTSTTGPIVIPSTISYTLDRH